MPKWLATDGVLAQFGARKSEARRLYRRFVAEGLERGSIWSGLRQQRSLGSEDFAERMQERLEIKGDELSVPKAQRRAPTPSLHAILEHHPERNGAIVAAYSTGAFSYREIGECFGPHLATVGRIIRRHMLQGDNPLGR